MHKQLNVTYTIRVEIFNLKIICCFRRFQLFTINALDNDGGTFKSD